MIKQIYQEWKERRKARIEECRNWMPKPYRITSEELEEINQLLEEMDKMEQRGGRGSRGRISEPPPPMRMQTASFRRKSKRSKQTAQV